jgi:hypothetical protein
MSSPRVITLLFLSCAGAFLSGCNNDDDEPTVLPQTILTLKVDQDYGQQGDRWIFASDENGEILDAQPYADGQTVTLTSEKHPDKINVTLFSYVVYETKNTQISFYTWGDVASGTTLHFKTIKVDNPSNPESGEATIRVSNYTGTAIVGISNGYGFSYGGSISNGNLEVDLSFYGVPSDILLYGWRSEVPVYYLATGVKSNDVIERDFMTDFTPYPHQFQLNFPGQNSALIQGYDAKKSLNITLMDTSAPNNLSDHPVIGYLDGFDSYDMTVTNVHENGSTTYHQKGAIDFSFDMPTYTFSLSDNTLQNFSFNFSHDYTYHTALWSHVAGKEYTWWTVNAPSGYAVKGLSIPSEIMAKYPRLDMNNLDYASLNFTEVIKGRSYEEFLPGATVANADGAVEDYVYRMK